MIDNIQIAKLSGSGNDFVCINNLDHRHDALLAAPDRVGHFARTLCRRGVWIGADGVIFANQPEIEERADFSARFFEADGSEAELCGNGTACFVRWVIDSGLVPDHEIRILTPAGICLGRNVGEGYYRVCIPLPHSMQKDVRFTAAGREIACDFAVAGVPHAVVYVDDVAKVDIETLGPAIRYHERFAPRGVNANFAQVLAEGELALRTWEFGVEGETLACGTGSATAAVLAAMRFGWSKKFTSNDQPVLVHVRSGDTLRVFVGIDDEHRITDLCLDTLVRPAFTGVLSPQLAREATSI